jgi:hypothetical protein
MIIIIIIIIKVFSNAKFEHLIIKNIKKNKLINKNNDGFILRV